MGIDVLVVGGGTAGSYVAWRLAALGFRCTLLEKGKLAEVGSSIGPFHVEEEAFARFDIPPPDETSPEYMHRIRCVTTWSPAFERSFAIEFPTLVLDKNLFTRRIHGYALEAGAELIEDAEVLGLLLEGGVLKGVRARTPEGEVELRARLVLDATGVAGAVRTRLPASSCFDNRPLTADDLIYVYMETWRDTRGNLAPDLNSFPWYIGWCAPGPGDTRIVGVGAGGSMEGAKRRHKAMLERMPLRGEVVSSASGIIPYRRPPYSLVDNCFISVGDAACMNKPFSGEGVTSGFAGCDIAVRTATSALSADDLTREGLWACNVEYFRGQGARFAFLMAVLPALMSLARDEMEFLFAVPGLLTEEAALSLQRDYAVVASAPSMGELVNLLAGIARGRLKAGSLVRIGRMAVAGTALKSLYERFPEEPIHLGPWLRAARFIWGRAERIKLEYFSRSSTRS